MISQIKNITLLMVIAFVIFSGCSTGRNGAMRQGKHRLIVPAGVDSTVAAKADTLADRLFVSIDREKRSDGYKERGKRHTSKSDTLWKYLSNDLGPGRQVSSEDEAKAVEAFNKGAVSLQKLSEMDQSAQDAYTKVKVEQLLLDAQKSFERAIVLNPFDLETKSWLARVYQTLAVRFLDENNNKRAAMVLENLVRIEKGEHSLFARLAEAYFAMEDWEEAHQNFVQAETVLRGASGLDFSETAEFTNAGIDTASMFYYAYYQGDTEIKLHDAVRGTASLKRALQYASTSKERADIASYIDWINWDDGNTRAAEARDKCIALQEEGDHKNAAKGFEKLLTSLRTKRASDEIKWRLAVLEFQYLERQEKGIERLAQVVKNGITNRDGVPLDTTYQRYFDSYGIMCHNLGLENYKKNRKVAYMYFQQSVAVAWESRAKSYLEIAKMSRNNPKAVVVNCEGALKNPEQLDAQEQMQAYQLLVEAMKRNGKFDEARRYYAVWMQMRNGTRRAGR